MMLGLLLARQGVRTIVLEKHGDFLRDFRGDTIHPSTQEILTELGLLDEFLHLPHRDMPEVVARVAGERVTFADFRRLPVTRKAVAFMPQWDFLSFLADVGAREEAFELRMSTRAVRLVRAENRVIGVETVSNGGTQTIHAPLVVAADGRDSVLRAQAGLKRRTLASAMDVLWLRVPRTETESLGFFHFGDGAVITIDRGDFYQIAVVVPTAAGREDSDGAERLRARIRRCVPELADRTAAIRMEDVRRLRVRLDRLRRWWRPGLLFIGDTAHAVSPVGGVGINLAIQDAVATANRLGPLLRSGREITSHDLRAVQRRRSLPAAVTQFGQARIQSVIVDGFGDGRVPGLITVVRRLPFLHFVVGRLVGLGIRPEHVRS